MHWLIALWSIAGFAATVDRIAAVVDDEVIAWSEIYELGGPFIEETCTSPLDTACRRGVEAQILDVLIQRVLVRHELDRLGLGVNADEVNRAVDSMVQQYGLADREALRREVEAQGLAWDAYRDQLQEQLREMKFSQSVIRPRVTVTDNEVLDAYQRTARQWAAPSQADLQAFAVVLPEAAAPEVVDGDLARLRAIVNELRAGQRDWMATVRELDQQGYAARDGRLGTVKKGQLPGELDGLVFSAATGDFVGPVRTPDGSALIVLKVVEIGASGLLPLEQVRGQLEEQLFTEKIEAESQQWYQQARRKATIRILLPAS